MTVQYLCIYIYTPHTKETQIQATLGKSEIKLSSRQNAFVVFVPVQYYILLNLVLSLLSLSLSLSLALTLSVK